jgi:HlyD family secretion protein
LIERTSIKRAPGWESSSIPSQKPSNKAARGWFPWIASATLLALAGIGVAMLPRFSPNNTKPAEAPAPIPRPAPEISLTGKIRAQNILFVSPPLEGILGAVFADVGQEVFEGQLLARIVNEGLETSHQIAERAVETTQARVNSIESEIVSARLEASRTHADASRARSEYDRLDKIYRRQQMLLAEGATPRLTYEKASREFDLAQSEFQSLERVAAQAEARIAELNRSLDAEKRSLDEKTGELETAAARSDATEVVSPAAGMVVGRSGEVGQSVGPDKPDLFQIARQLSELEVVLDPDPRAMIGIRPGQPALVSLVEQGFSGMPGAVKSIMGAQVVVGFTSPNPAVKPGMTAQVRIKTGPQP